MDTKIYRKKTNKLLKKLDNKTREEITEIKNPEIWLHIKEEEQRAWMDVLKEDSHLPDKPNIDIDFETGFEFFEKHPSED